MSNIGSRAGVSITDYPQLLVPVMNPFIRSLSLTANPLNTTKKNGRLQTHLRLIKLVKAIDLIGSLPRLVYLETLLVNVHMIELFQSHQKENQTWDHEINSRPGPNNTFFECFSNIINPCTRNIIYFITIILFLSQVTNFHSYF